MMLPVEDKNGSRGRCQLKMKMAAEDATSRRRRWQQIVLPVEV